MKSNLKLIIAAAAVALFVPAMAIATPNGHSNGHAHSGATGNTGATGPNYAPAPPPQAKAYGVICKNESKEHHEGEKGTAFSRCVTALAHAHNHPNQAPGQVCKGKSKKHVKGEKGTEFSRCVHDVVKLRQQERREQREQEGTQGS
jgi:hypothetical protein